MVLFTISFNLINLSSTVPPGYKKTAPYFYDYFYELRWLKEIRTAWAIFHKQQTRLAHRTIWVRRVSGRASDSFCTDRPK